MPPSMHRIWRKSAAWALLTQPAPVSVASKNPSLVLFNQATTTAQSSEDRSPAPARRSRSSVRPVPKSRSKTRRWLPPDERQRNCGPVSPTNALVQRLRTRNEPITAESWSKARFVAASRSHRQSVLAHQVLLKMCEEELETSLTQVLAGDPVQWQHRLNTFALKGIQEDDVRHWIWILEAESTDTKVERLVSTTRFKPIFVLMAILRTDEHMAKGSTLVKVYDYIARTYIALSLEARRAWKAELDSGVQVKTLDSLMNMTPHHFTLAIKRLVHHALQTFPSSLTMISRLVVDYIRAMGDWKPKRGGQLSGYAVRCLVFNTALIEFRRTPPVTPVSTLPHNWKAQKILLSYSAGLRRPFIITRHAYKAIRIVLVGLQKSENEKLTASRHAKTWPPYIRQWDGTDEAREKGAYYSRSVKAGILKQSEGYSHNLVDFAMDRLGGALPEQSISIQTRSAAKSPWRNQHKAAQIFTYWAAKLKATRNSYEAWRIFQQPPLPGIQPDFQVYAEMFEKLYAMEVDEASPSLPGDGKETYPPYLANLTDIERGRVSPCSPEELYESMIRIGQRPVHECLSVLIRNAPSVGKACQYLNDSPLPKDAVHNMTVAANPNYQHLARIPVAIFDAYLRFLCGQQGSKRWSSGPYKVLHPTARVRYSYLDRAIHLICARSGPRGKVTSGPWHTVMRALAHDSLVMRPTVSWAEDDVAALEAMMQLWGAYHRLQSSHPVPFDCLCRCILKVLRHKLPQDDGRHHQNVHRTHLIRNARRLVDAAFDIVKPAFAALITPVERPSDARLQAATDTIPPLYHELSASHIRTYIEVLAKLGDVDEAMHVMDWVLMTCDPEREADGGAAAAAIFAKARDPSHKQWAMMREATVCFRAFVEAMNVDPAVLAKIQARFEDINAKIGAWSWPSTEDVQVYRQWQQMEAVPET